jgi:hypothetical protein
MSEASIESDKQVGVALALGAIAVVGAVVLFGHPSQIGKAWGFGAAFLFALCSVVAVQIFD